MSRLDGWIAGQFQIKPEQLNRQELEQRQLTMMNQLLVWCKTNSSYYQDYPKQLQSLQDLQKLPFITAETVAQQGTQMVCLSQSEISRVVTMQTSGTSGCSKRLYFSQADQQLTIDFFACGLSEMNQAGDRCLILMPGNRPGGMNDLIQQALYKIQAVPITCSNDCTFAEIAALLHREQVTTMVGSPVQILSLARYLKHYGLPHCIQAVLVSSDYLAETVRKAIEQSLSCTVFDHYGITEGGLGFSIECKAHQGLHIRENDLLVEIIHPKTGEVVPDGQWGELVFTTLTRRAMPLIRYRTGDKARLLAEACACGSVIKRMDKIAGRIQQLQDAYCMPALDEVILQIPQVLDYQARYCPQLQQLKLYLLLTTDLATVETVIRTALQPLLQDGDFLLLTGEPLGKQQRHTVKSLYRGKRSVMMERI